MANETQASPSPAKFRSRHLLFLIVCLVAVRALVLVLRMPPEALSEPSMEGFDATAGSPAYVTVSQASGGQPLKDQPHFRGPVSAAWIVPNLHLAVANRCGTVSIVDVAENAVIEEVLVGQRLATIKAHPSGILWLTVDEARHELVELVRSGSSLTVSARHPVAKYPVDLEVSSDGNLVGVASMWSRKVTLFNHAPRRAKSNQALLHAATRSLRFNPGSIDFHEAMGANGLRANEQEFAGAPFFLVADAFAESRALIATKAPFRVADSGIALATTLRGSSYAWSHHMLTPNEVYWLTLPNLPDPKKPIPENSETYDFFLSDRGVPLGPAGHTTPALRGERLFTTGGFGKERLASVAGQTCNYCHRRGHTKYELADTVADGTKGAPKRIPTLMGTRLTDPWAWNGGFRDLSEQIRSSLKNTMHVTSFTDEQVADLAAYLHTLPPPPPLEPATDDPVDRAKLARGKELFTGLGCGRCHVPPLTYTSPDTYDVGLEDEKGLKKFNPPSLRGVSQGYSFFHDGRAKTLEEVFTVYGHQLDRDLSKDELSDLLRFLRSI